MLLRSLFTVREAKAGSRRLLGTPLWLKFGPWSLPSGGYVHPLPMVIGSRIVGATPMV